MNLEDLEREVELRFQIQAAAVDGGDRIVLHCECEPDDDTAAIETHVARLLAVPLPAVVVRRVATLPRMPSGKKDYRELGAAE